MPFVRVLRSAAVRFARDGAAFFAQAIAFNILFSAIPLTLVFVAMLGFVYGTAGSDAAALQLIGTYAPAMLGLVAANLDSVVQHRGWSGAFGFIGLLWSAKNVFQALGYALDLSLQVPRHRAYVHDVALAIVLVPIAGVVFVAASALPVAISIIVRLTGLGSLRYVASYVPEAATYAVSLGVVFVVSALLYTFLPNRKAPGPGFGVPGAAVTAIGWSLAQVAFAVYTTHTNFLRIYGALSTAFALLLWVYFSAMIFLYGAYVSAAWEQRVRNAAARVEAA